MKLISCPDWWVAQGADNGSMFQGTMQEVGIEVLLANSYFIPLKTLSVE